MNEVTFASGATVVPAARFFRPQSWNDGGTVSAALSSLGVKSLLGTAAIAADFNNDGITDVIFAVAEFVVPAGSSRTGPAPGRIFMLYGRADGSFVDASSNLPDGGAYDATIRKFRAGDFNGDGVLDFLPVSNYEDGRLIPTGDVANAPQYVYLSHQGQFTKVALGLTTWAHGVAVGDFNGDGKSDFYLGGFTIGAGMPSAGAAFIQGNPGAPLKPTFLPNYPNSSTNEIADINGDGRGDFIATGVAIGNAGGFVFETRLMQADGQFAPAVYQDLPYIRLENGLTWSNDPSIMRIGMSNGQEFVDQGYHDSVLVDMDGDQKLDFVGFRFGFDLNYVNGVLSEAGAKPHYAIDIFEIGPGGKFVAKPVTFQGWKASEYFVGFQVLDFNHDGHPDIYLQTANNNGMPALYLNDGANRFSRVGDEQMPSVQTNNAVQFTSIAGDFNRDGNVDILIRPYSTSGEVPPTSVTTAAFYGNASLSTGPGYIRSTQAPGFNEAYYLNEHQDVGAFLKNGQYGSALDYYLAVGKALGHAAFAPGTTVFGGDTADVINLREGNEIAYGAGGNDRITGGPGNDVIDGGEGVDTAIFTGARAAYSVTKTDYGLQVVDKSGVDGTDQLKGVERLMFFDGVLGFDVDGAVGKVYRTYQAAFDRIPDSGGLGFWVKAMDNGMSLTSVAGGFMASDEFKKLYGTTPTNAEFVEKLYLNVLHRPGEPAGVEFWVNTLSHPEVSKESVLAAFAESAENQANLIGVLDNGVFYQVYH